MINMRLMLAAIALAMMVLAVATFRRQAKAASCPRHSRMAGKAALIVGWASLIGGVGLMGYALLLVRT
jgi:uncharacterized membrane protein